jgi:hypothetical protein
MPFTGNEDHAISLEEAGEFTARYREGLAPEAKIGGFFGKATLERILNQTDCVGIRYYYGIDNNNAQVLVLVGALADQDDIVDGELAEISLPCPNWCGKSNALNSIL